MLLGALLVPVVEADEIRRSRDAGGRPKITIEGSAAEPPAGDEGPAKEERVKERLSVDASLRRRELRRELAAKTEELERIRARVKEIEQESITLHAQTLPTELEDVQRAIDSERQAFLALRAYEEKKRERLSRLRREERQTLRDVLAVWSSFRELEARVVEAFGGAPTWWRGAPECNGCPTEDEAKEQLIRASEVEPKGSGAPRTGE